MPLTGSTRGNSLPAADNIGPEHFGPSVPEFYEIPVEGKRIVQFRYDNVDMPYPAVINKVMAYRYNSLAVPAWGYLDFPCPA